MSEVCVMYAPPFPAPYEGIESSLYRSKSIRTFLDKIRQKDIDIAVRDLCLLGIEVFKDRNPSLAHYSLKEIQRCLHNFIEEKNTRDYYNQMNPSSTDEEYECENNRFETSQFYKTSNPSLDNSLNSRSLSKSRSGTKSRPDSMSRSKSRGRNQDTKEHKNLKVMFETPSKSNSHQKNKSMTIYDDQNSSFQIDNRESRNEDKDLKPSKRIAPSHSNVNIHPIEYMGPPPRVSPYFYMTDKDFEIINGQKNNQRAVTTISCTSDTTIKDKIMNRVATSPLKSCLKNVEVKVAKGGIAVSFDPWKENVSQNNENAANKSMKESDLKDHLNSELNNQEKIEDGKFINSIVKSIGIQPKIDPKVQKFVVRDMEQAKKKRETLEIQRQSEKKKRKGSQIKDFNRPVNRQYQKVQSKIKKSVVHDRSKARVKSSRKNTIESLRSFSKSPEERKNKVNDDLKIVKSIEKSESFSPQNLVLSPTNKAMIAQEYRSNDSPYKIKSYREEKQKIYKDQSDNVDTHDINKADLKTTALSHSKSNGNMESDNINKNDNVNELKLVQNNFVDKIEQSQYRPVRYPYYKTIEEDCTAMNRPKMFYETLY